MNTIGDAAKFLSGGTPRKSTKAYWNGDIPWFSASNMSNKFLSVSDLNITEQGLKAGSRIAPSGATLLLVRGSGLFNHIPICFADRDVAFNQDVKAIVAQDGVDPLYLHYTLESHRYELSKNVGVTGIGAGKFDTDFLRQLDFIHRQKGEQEEIGQLASAYDRKIELNRRMNETLEAMAQAIFRDWFVDFGPTRRKLEGASGAQAVLGGLIAPPEKAARIAALFPDTLGDDGLPVGWEGRSLDEIATFLNGLALQKYPTEDPEDSLPVIKIAELRNGVTGKSNRASRAVPDKYVVRDGDFLFSWSGSLMAKFWTAGEGALNQHLFKVSSDAYPTWFYTHWVYKHLAEFQKIAASKATTMGHIQRGHLKAAKTVCPSDDAWALMGEIMEPIMQKTIQNDLENRTLSATRDLLLPKLMSGELRLRDAETAL